MSDNMTHLGLKIPEALKHSARIQAARRNQTLSAFVLTILQKNVKPEDSK